MATFVRIFLLSAALLLALSFLLTACAAKRKPQVRVPERIVCSNNECWNESDVTPDRDK